MLNFVTFLASLGLAEPDDDHHYKPYSRSQPRKHLEDRFDTLPVERTGPFKTVYYWNQLDYAFPTEEARRRAIENRTFIQENNLPLGLEIYKDRLFVTMPKWKTGIPATLAVLPRVPKERSPKLVPYPNWEYHTAGMMILINVAIILLLLIFINT